MHTIPRALVTLFVCAAFPALLMAQANVTIFAAYNFEDPTNATNFYSDSSSNGHNMPNSTGFGITSSNLAPTGGSYAFNGAGGGLFAWNVTGGSVNQATNWGLELLFKNPGSTSSTVSTEIFSVGDANINGMSILYNPATNRIEGKLNGIQAFGSATYTPGAWNSVSLVNNGTTTTLWVNYAVAATLNSNPTVPNSVWHAFVISGGAVSYTGLADNVRVFTFTGDYTAANISAIPEPSTYAALAGLLAIGAVAWRRRVR